MTILISIIINLERGNVDVDTLSRISWDQMHQSKSLFKLYFAADIQAIGSSKEA